MVRALVPFGGSGDWFAAWSEAGRSPRLVVLENVCGALTSHQGQDFAALANALVDAGYRFGAVVVNAVHFCRNHGLACFIIGVLNQQAIPEQLITTGPEAEWHPPALVDAYGEAFSLYAPGLGLVALAYSEPRASVFADLIEDAPSGVAWHRAEETRKLLSMMSPRNLAKVEAAQQTGRRMVSAIYRRTRTEG